MDVGGSNENGSTGKRAREEDDEDVAASPTRAAAHVADVNIDDDCIFLVSFDQASPLRTLIDVISNVLVRVEIYIVNTESFQGIQIESIDAKQVCLINAKLVCTVHHMVGEARFCVDTQTFITCLKAVPPHFSLRICGSTQTSDITLHSYESISNNYCTTFDVPTLVSDSEPVKLSPMDYTFTVELDVLTMRTIVKNTLALHGNDIRFTVEEQVGDLPFKYNIFTISTDGNAKQKHQFHSVTQSRSNATCIIRTDETAVDLPPRGELTTRYEDCFSANYLNNFLKAMERQTIDLFLSPGKPLIFQYKLGPEQSRVCFVLAAKAEAAGS